MDVFPCLQFEQISESGRCYLTLKFLVCRIGYLGIHVNDLILNSEMKKSITILVVALYGVLSIGVHIHLHYCCGKLSGMELISEPNACCSNEENPGCSVSHQCCTFTLLDFSIEDEHYSSSFQYLIPLPKEDFLPSVSFLAEVKNDVNPIAPDDYGLKRKLFLEHSSLIYYA